MTLLSNALPVYQVVLHAYVLMSNHFHLIIQTKKSNCSEFMRYLNICYTGWYNWRHKRCGNLYQGRYKAFLIDADDYLLTVSRYLHLNPIRKMNADDLTEQEIFHHLLTYAWSSLAGYIYEKRRFNFVHYDFVLSMAGGRKEYLQYTLEGIKNKAGNPFDNIKGGFILGNKDFINKSKQYILKGSKREQPDYNDIQKIEPMDPTYIITLITRTMGVDETVLKTRNRCGFLRGMTAELLYRYCHTTQKQIGDYIGKIDYISVQMLRRRLKERIKKDPRSRESFERLISIIEEKMYNEKI